MNQVRRFPRLTRVPDRPCLDPGGAICEAVQSGLHSATYRSGRYSVLRENGLHHFHSLLSRLLL